MSGVPRPTKAVMEWAVPETEERESSSAVNGVILLRWACDVDNARYDDGSNHYNAIESHPRDRVFHDDVATDPVLRHGVENDSRKILENWR